MGFAHRVIKLDAGRPNDGMRFFSDVLRVDALKLSEGKRNVVATVIRTGKFFDPRYGDFEITKEMLLSFISNFKANVYGQEIMLDKSHRPDEGSAGFFKQMFLDSSGGGFKLRAEIELTEFGVELITKKGFIYLSADFVENFIDNETKKSHGPLLRGAALTPRPVIKHLDPIDRNSVQLSEDALDDVPTFMSDRIKSILLSEETNMNWLDKLKAKLKAKLVEFKLADGLVASIVSSYQLAVEQSGIADEAKGLLLMEHFVTTGKTLAEGAAPGEIKLSFSGMSPAEIDAALNAKLDERDQARATKAVKLSELKDRYTGKLNASESFKALPDDMKAKMLAAADLITADMADATVDNMATMQLSMAENMSASVQLAQMGYQVQGSVRISVDESNKVKQLSEVVTTELRKTYKAQSGELILSEKLHPFAEKVLAEYDRINMPSLVREHAIMLAGGETSSSDTALPKNFVRSVIQEALSDTNVLALVQTLTDFGATATTDIPYETRDMGNVTNDGVVYEGGAIHRASISQAMDLAYVLPMKIAFLISNEVMHFTRVSAMNWDAYARNLESNARILRELVARRICNEMQRAADAYGAVAVNNEGVDAQLTGAVSIVKTVNYPIVRPHQQRDLKGNAVGAVENPIVVRLNGAAIGEYDGTNTQAVATYYRVINYNLGYVQFVNQLGAAVTPPNAAGADDISYSYATNVAKVDLDLAGATVGIRMNDILKAVGDRKALMRQDRFVAPNFLLMGYTLNNNATNAANFEADSKRKGTDTNNDGDLEMIKGVSAFSTNAPGVDIGEERILMGQRGTLSYTIAKPFSFGAPFEAVDSNGNAIGKKQSYGEEYSALKVPTPIRNRLTSVIAYSFTGR